MDLYALLVRRAKGTALVENSFMIPQKVIQNYPAVSHQDLLMKN
jgi:hypothetical protein